MIRDLIHEVFSIILTAILLTYAVIVAGFKMAAALFGEGE